MAGTPGCQSFLRVIAKAKKHWNGINVPRNGFHFGCCIVICIHHDKSPTKSDWSIWTGEPLSKSGQEKSSDGTRQSWN
jgi:hypothetical protein